MERDGWLWVPVLFEWGCLRERCWSCAEGGWGMLCLVRDVGGVDEYLDWALF